MALGGITQMQPLNKAIPDQPDALGPTFRFDENGSAKSRLMAPLQNLSAERALARIYDLVQS